MEKEVTGSDFNELNHMASKSPQRSSNASRAKPRSASFNMWRTLNNVLIASMNKGLFIPACLFFVVLMMLYKTPGAYLPELWKALGDFRYWGYILAVAAVTGWGINVRYLKRIHQAEMENVAAEKRKLQEELSGRSLPSSRSSRKS